jgi:hypothetical protein
LVVFLVVVVVVVLESDEWMAYRSQLTNNPTQHPMKQSALGPKVIVHSSTCCSNKKGVKNHIRMVSIVTEKKHVLSLSGNRIAIRGFDSLPIIRTN